MIQGVVEYNGCDFFRFNSGARWVLIDVLLIVLNMYWEYAH